MTFDEAEKSPQLPALMAFTPDTSPHVMGIVVIMSFVGLFAAVSAVMTFFFIVTGPGVLCPALVTLISGGIFLKILIGLFKFRAAPMLRVLAIVRDETTEVSATTSGSGRTRTTSIVKRHYLLLETKEGNREAFQCDDDLARRVIKGDVGCAYVKGGSLIDFRPVLAATA